MSSELGFVLNPERVASSEFPVPKPQCPTLKENPLRGKTVESLNANGVAVNN